MISMKDISLNQLLSKSLSPDRNVLVCHLCEKKYSGGSEDYCQICCKLYVPESEEILVDVNLGNKNTNSSTEVCIPNGKTSQEDENNLMVSSLHQLLESPTH
jgi:hypothetical protein